MYNANIYKKKKIANYNTEFCIPNNSTQKIKTIIPGPFCFPVLVKTVVNLDEEDHNYKYNSNLYGQRRISLNNNPCSCSQKIGIPDSWIDYITYRSLKKDPNMKMYLDKFMEHKKDSISIVKALYKSHGVAPVQGIPDPYRMPVINHYNQTEDNRVSPSKISKFDQKFNINDYPWSNNKVMNNNSKLKKQEINYTNNQCYSESNNDSDLEEELFANILTIDERAIDENNVNNLHLLMKPSCIVKPACVRKPKKSERRKIKSLIQDKQAEHLNDKLITNMSVNHGIVNNNYAGFVAKENLCLTNNISMNSNANVSNNAPLLTCHNCNNANKIKSCLTQTQLLSNHNWHQNNIDCLGNNSNNQNIMNNELKQNQKNNNDCFDAFNSNNFANCVCNDQKLTSNLIPHNNVQYNNNLPDSNTNSNTNNMENNCNAKDTLLIISGNNINKYLNYYLNSNQYISQSGIDFKFNSNTDNINDNSSKVLNIENVLTNNDTKNNKKSFKKKNIQNLIHNEMRNQNNICNEENKENLFYDNSIPTRNNLNKSLNSYCSKRNDQYLDRTECQLNGINSKRKRSDYVDNNSSISRKHCASGNNKSSHKYNNANNQYNLNSDSCGQSTKSNVDKIYKRSKNKNQDCLTRTENNTNHKCVEIKSSNIEITNSSTRRNENALCFKNKKQINNEDHYCVAIKGNGKVHNELVESESSERKIVKCQKSIKNLDHHLFTENKNDSYYETEKSESSIMSIQILNLSKKNNQNTGSKIKDANHRSIKNVDHACVTNKEMKSHHRFLDCESSTLSDYSSRSDKIINQNVDHIKEKKRKQEQKEEFRRDENKQTEHQEFLNIITCKVQNSTNWKKVLQLNRNSNTDSSDQSVNSNKEKNHKRITNTNQDSLTRNENDTQYGIEENKSSIMCMQVLSSSMRNNESTDIKKYRNQKQIKHADHDSVNKNERKDHFKIIESVSSTIRDQDLSFDKMKCQNVSCSKGKKDKQIKNSTKNECLSYQEFINIITSIINNKPNTKNTMEQNQSLGADEVSNESDSSIEVKKHKPNKKKDNYCNQNESYKNNVLRSTKENNVANNKETKRQKIKNADNDCTTLIKVKDTLVESESSTISDQSSCCDKNKCQNIDESKKMEKQVKEQNSVIKRVNSTHGEFLNIFSPLIGDRPSSISELYMRKQRINCCITKNKNASNHEIAKCKSSSTQVLHFSSRSFPNFGGEKIARQKQIGIQGESDCAKKNKEIAHHKLEMDNESSTISYQSSSCDNISNQNIVNKIKPVKDEGIDCISIDENVTPQELMSIITSIINNREHWEKKIKLNQNVDKPSSQKKSKLKRSKQEDDDCASKIEKDNDLSDDLCTDKGKSPNSNNNLRRKEKRCRKEDDDYASMNINALHNKIGSYEDLCSNKRDVNSNRERKQKRSKHEDDDCASKIEKDNDLNTSDDLYTDKGKRPYSNNNIRKKEKRCRKEDDDYAPMNINALHNKIGSYEDLCSNKRDVNSNRERKQKRSKHEDDDKGNSPNSNNNIRRKEKRCRKEDDDYAPMNINALHNKIGSYEDLCSNKRDVNSNRERKQKRSKHEDDDCASKIEKDNALNISDDLCTDKGKSPNSNNNIRRKEKRCRKEDDDYAPMNINPLHNKIGSYEDLCSKRDVNTNRERKQKCFKHEDDDCSKIEKDNALNISDDLCTDKGKRPYSNNNIRRKEKRCRKDDQDSTSKNKKILCHELNFSKELCSNKNNRNADSNKVIEHKQCRDEDYNYTTEKKIINRKDRIPNENSIKEYGCKIENSYPTVESMSCQELEIYNEKPILNKTNKEKSNLHPSISIKDISEYKVRTNTMDMSIKGNSEMSLITSEKMVNVENFTQSIISTGNKKRCSCEQKEHCLPLCSQSDNVGKRVRLMLPDWKKEKSVLF